MKVMKERYRTHNGARYTQQYQDELDYALERMQQALAERLE